MPQASFPNLTVLTHPLIAHKLSILRDRDTSTRDFKQLVGEIATLMAYEVTKDLPTEPVEIEGARLFHVRLPLPASVPTGDYRVEVLLVRSRQIVARQELAFRVDRVGAADRIATVAQTQPLVYGLACILFAALAGWLGSVLFRRG